MLFRTKFVAAVTALALVAIGCAALLILSAQRNELNQTRKALAYESLSGYFQLSGTIFRTFKQARRDLISGSGEFNFDFVDAKISIFDTLSELETTSRSEAFFTGKARKLIGLEKIKALRLETSKALDAIEQASELILSGKIEEGRRKAIAVLEGQVDAEIATLMEAAIEIESRELTAAQEEVRSFNEWSQILAWVSVVTALLLSILLLFTLVRRFSNSLKALDRGAQEYATDNLAHVISLPGNDELSAVANRFTEMARQILTKRNDLERAQQHLEQRVEERTAKLSELNNELQERDRLRRQFFADIGHELRTPVTAIRGEAEVALRSKQDIEAAHRHALNTIVTLSEQLTDNVSDLFLVARQQAGVLDFRNHPLDLNSSIAPVVEQMRSLAVEKSATITKSVWPGELEIEGDSNRIAQLLRILISNALSHSPDGVCIDVTTSINADNAILSVSDDGPGIAEQDRERIFDRYVKGLGETERSASGTGLGLAIAKSITEAHGGSISVSASAAGGSIFTMQFPLIKVA